MNELYVIAKIAPIVLGASLIIYGLTTWHAKKRETPAVTVEAKHVRAFSFLLGAGAVFTALAIAYAMTWNDSSEPSVLGMLVLLALAPLAGALLTWRRSFPKS